MLSEFAVVISSTSASTDWRQYGTAYTSFRSVRISLAFMYIRKISLLFLLLSIFSYTLQAQDSIRTIKGLTLVGELKKVSPYEVSFVKYSKNGRKLRNSSGSYLINRLSASEITEIVYADGKRDSMLPVPETASDTAGRYYSKRDYYRLGANDAKLYYHKYTGATLSTFLITFPGSPLVGLFVAIGTANRPPSPKRFTYPNAALTNNEDYTKGYAQRAHKIKAGKVWGAWTAGAILTAASLLVMQAVGNK
jgi:hypothetical protein